MRATARLGAMQARAQSLMTLTLAAYSPDGKTTNPGGYTVPKFASEGLTFGRVQATSGGDTTTRYIKIGDVERPVIKGGLQIPLTAKVPVAGEQRGTGWEYVVLAVGPLDDLALLGRRYLVVAVPAKSHATMRRLTVVEV
ncbi:DUF6093 family protein [Nocardioides nitrophenolicus]|uniref:DUF6093 family protein n=1 Tax=Nocardioides nitrophenolicus TaxID=60489 RepID=UPI00195C45AB|nr:DUF6093 family protein [Nocardioides nitrophenolicus]MBM7518276.1 hypothetical protein [Nocardioides nitrophenolicus]